MTRSSQLPIVIALCALLLSACSMLSRTEESRRAPVTPPVSFKVHPGLLGEPVPPELQKHSPGPDTSLLANAEEESGQPSQQLQTDNDGLYTQRSVYFDFDSVEIREEFSRLIQAHSQYLASHPQARVKVEGNADERGAAHYNKVLGMRRAHAVKNALISGGAKDKQVKTVTLGDTHPKLVGKDEASWAENRRADIVYEQK